jgi:hypothetical protein
MTTFEFAFSLFGLLLGFTLVEVLAGIVRTTRREGLATRHLYLTTALGVLVSLDLITFWTVLYAARDVIPGSTLALYAGFAISGAYYWAASMIFPGAGEKAADLDAHYFRVRRKVLGAVIGCNLALFGSIVAILGVRPELSGVIEFTWGMALLAALMLLRSKKASVALISLVILNYIGFAAWRAL